MRWRSNRQRINNSVYKIKDREKWINNLSKSIKTAIHTGKFTPPITNSWCRSRISVNVNNITVNVRSSWEAFFLLKNPTFLYEKIRIPYIDVYGNNRMYIVDFVDDDGNLYEIKPTSLIGNNHEKIKAAEEYCSNNNISFNIIDDDYFKITKSDLQTLLFGQPNKDILYKRLIRYENKKNN